MALPQRSDQDPGAVPFAVPATFRPGGEVGRMHAELAERLAAARLAAAPGEPIIRAVSSASGYLLLLLAYGGVALLFWR